MAWAVGLWSSSPWAALQALASLLPRWWSNTQIKWTIFWACKHNDHPIQGCSWTATSSWWSCSCCSGTRRWDLFLLKEYIFSPKNWNVQVWASRWPGLGLRANPPRSSCTVQTPCSSSCRKSELWINCNWRKRVLYYVRKSVLCWSN